jgi:hypothetical protein
MNKKIDYAKIGSILRSNSTEELQKSVAEELKATHKPLSIEELTEMSTPLGGGGRIDWSKTEPTEEEYRKEEGLQIDQIDQALDTE